MLAPFFDLAARSPSRQGTFRRTVAAHLALLGGAAFALCSQHGRPSPVLLGHVLLVAGILEGAALVGWRLTQMPKSQALEFLLVSPLRPRRLFLAEAAVGLAMLALVTLSGLPVLAILAGIGLLHPLDLLPLLGMPLAWGALTGLGLAAWAYEPKAFRRWGEAALMLLVLAYLVVGVLAGERLRDWLVMLPDEWRVAFLRAFWTAHAWTPFAVMHAWLGSDVGAAWDRAFWLQSGACAAIVLFLWRSSGRLEGHFHELHHEPVRDVRDEKRPAVGDAPLSWWAVKRVMVYSGRLNLWLAGGFCLLYGAYLVAGDRWPAWMGRRIFEQCDGIGGVAALTAALAVLAAVPAAFQYGIWDSNAQDRCRRLELLLLTGLGPRDYWDASSAAAWRRGRGYLAIAAGLWLAGYAGGRLGLADVAALASACALLWGLYFALGFQGFAAGTHANGLGMLLTVGLPLAAFALAKLGWPALAAFLPPGMVYDAGTGRLPLLGSLAAGAVALAVGHRARAGCDADLRRWYAANHGSKLMT